MSSDLNHSDVYMIAQKYSTRELISLISDMPVDCSDLDGFLTYKPWRDIARADAYRREIKEGRFTEISETISNQGIHEYGHDVQPAPIYFGWNWKQPSVTTKATLFTPSQIFHWNWLLHSQDAETPERQDRESLAINLKIGLVADNERIRSLFTEEQLSQLPRKALENIEVTGER